jgi:uncharacterized integral membrane protein (TIGR00698 family)
VGAVIALMPFTSSALSLLLGVILALTCGNPYFTQTRKLVRPLLSWSIVGLGAGMNLMVVGRAGMNGIMFTILSLSFTLALGWVIGKLLNTSRDTSTLINVGTAICGGSAIAAISSAIHADDNDSSVALGIVFILNACALLVFPPIGHALDLTQIQFGLWSALAIHDTSSVVGASLQYGAQALEVGTTVKLVRALWIIPLTLVFAKMYAIRNKSSANTKQKYPWFILGFLGAAALVTWFPALQDIGHKVEWLGRHLLILTLFFIGTGLTRATLQKVGLRALAQGVLLWICVGVGSLIAIRFELLSY